LVEGFDQVVRDAAGGRERGELTDVARLVHAAGRVRAARSSDARPARLTDQDLLAGEPSPHLGIEPVHVRDHVVDPDRVVIPVRNDVNGDERDRVGHRAVVHPVPPHVGIRHRETALGADAADQRAQLCRRQLVAQQHLVADHDRAHDRAMLACDPEHPRDLGFVEQRVATDPRADEDTQAELGRDRRHLVHAVADRVGPDAVVALREQREVLADLAPRHMPGHAVVGARGRVGYARESPRRRVRQRHRTAIPPPRGGETEREHGKECREDPGTDGRWHRKPILAEGG
jgi:hypothetical protein